MTIETPASYRGCTELFSIQLSCPLSPGSIWNVMPVTYKNWEVHIQVHIHGSGRTLYGDGLAFWYTKDRSKEGGLFGSKDHFSGVGVFLDTFQNNVYSNQVV